LNAAAADSDVPGQFGVPFQPEADKPLPGVDAVEESALNVADYRPECSQ
jgi:hypothetical protein